jgi:hypothetical protein
MSPERYGCLDFKVSGKLVWYLIDPIFNNTYLLQVEVQPAALEYVREKFAPPSDPVFELVPPIFAHYASSAYAEIGSPDINSENIWMVYREIVERLTKIAEAGEDENYIDSVDQWEISENLQDRNTVFYPLIAGQELSGHQHEDGSIYLGGVNGGQGLGRLHTNRALGYPAIYLHQTLIQMPN